MVNMTLAIPDELHKKMRRRPEIKWSEIARRAIRMYVEELEQLDTLTSDSRLREEDIDELDHKIKKGLSRHYRKSSK
jgi:hypothetical protein